MHKKIISLLLAVAVLFAVALPASAKIVPEAERLPLIIVNGMNEPHLTKDNGDIAYPPTTGEFVAAALKIIGMLPLLAINQGGLYGDLSFGILRKLFDATAYLPDGTPKYQLNLQRFPDAYGKDKTGLIDTVSHGHMARLYGMDRTYQFGVDFRESGLVQADALNAFVERVKKEHKVKKVNMIAVSMGGATMTGYLAKYGSGSVNNLVMMHTVFQGMYIVGDLFNGRLSFASEPLQLWLAQSLEGNDPWAGIVGAALGWLDGAGYLDSVLDWASGLMDSIQPRVFDDFLVPSLCQFPGFWGCVPDADYESAKALLLDPVEHAKLIKIIDDYHYNVFNKASSLFNKAMKGGTNVYVLSGYNLAGPPVGPRALAQTDDGLTTACTSGGATCAPLGQPFKKSYKQAVACGHNHISPDRLIDASTCMLPEQTWFQKDLHHTNFYPDDNAQFLLWLAASDKRVNVRTKAAYPQFQHFTEGKLVPLGGGETLKKK